MCDAIQTLASAVTLGVQLYTWVQDWRAANKAIPGELASFGDIVQTINNVLEPIKDIDDKCAPLINRIFEELKGAQHILEKYKKKSKSKFFVNPKAVLGDLTESTSQLKSLLDLLVKARSLTAGQNFNAATNIHDKEALRFWSAKFGTAKLDIDYSAFCSALRSAFTLNPGQLSNLAKGSRTLQTLNVYDFDSVTSKYTMHGVIDLLKTCNPFTETPPDESAFYIVSETGVGVLQPYGNCEDPNTPLCVAAERSGLLQMWRWNGTNICNAKTGFAIDISPAPDLQGMRKLIVMPQNTYAISQNWKLGGDGVLRTDTDPTQCMDLDRGSKLVILWEWRAGKDNQLWRKEDYVPEPLPPTPNPNLPSEPYPTPTNSLKTSSTSVTTSSSSAIIPPPSPSTATATATTTVTPTEPLAFVTGTPTGFGAELSDIISGKSTILTNDMLVIGAERNKAKKKT
ncbi:hypothetical protein Pelo_10936 [Pelomyxa schiedti]|nr:hypothetical protein Pelo_10936 [Pelomyxa schiedti]